VKIWEKREKALEELDEETNKEIGGEMEDSSLKLGKRESCDCKWGGGGVKGDSWVQTEENKTLRFGLDGTGSTIKLALRFSINLKVGRFGRVGRRKSLGAHNRREPFRKTGTRTQY